MKLYSDFEDKVQVFGDQEEFEFTIDNKAKIFRTLVKGLYSNPLAAPIREYMTNAYDAHIEAGYRDRPFSVQLPTKLNPVFKVRDFGLGMSHEKVRTVYSKFGESTKDDSNLQVGMLGYGSKSAFAYTTSFNVRSYFEGKVTAYLIFMSVKGIPTVKIVGEESTEEHSGVEISFAVKSTDIIDFLTTFSKIALGFNPRPIILNLGSVGGDKFLERLSPSPVFEQDKFKLYNYSGVFSGFDASALALQGCVIYPINPTMVSMPTDFKKLCSFKALIEFEIGELSIQDSREELLYDEKTKKAIETSLDAFMNVFIKDKESVILAETCEWKAAKLLLRWNRSYQTRWIYERLLSQKPPLVINGFKIADVISEKHDLSKFKELENQDQNGAPVSSVELASAFKKNRTFKPIKSSNVFLNEKEVNVESPDIAVILENPDLEVKHKKSKLKLFLENNLDKTVVKITTKLGLKDPFLIRLQKITRNTTQVTWLEKLKKPETISSKLKNNANNFENLTIYCLNPASYNKLLPIGDSEKDKVVAKGGFYYTVKNKLPTQEFEILIPKDRFLSEYDKQIQTAKRIIQVINFLSIPSEEVLAVSSFQEARLVKSGNWRPLYLEVLKRFEELADLCFDSINSNVYEIVLPSEETRALAAFLGLTIPDFSNKKISKSKVEEFCCVSSMLFEVHPYSNSKFSLESLSKRLADELMTVKGHSKDTAILFDSLLNPKYRYFNTSDILEVIKSKFTKKENS
jgi:hypothetical protein